jgi:hypothetical protein
MTQIVGAEPHRPRALSVGVIAWTIALAAAVALIVAIAVASWPTAGPSDPTPRPEPVADVDQGAPQPVELCRPPGPC